MPLFEWEEKYSVGVKAFDAQHSTLVDYINELFDAMRERKANAVIGGILDKLVNYTRTHFADEEKIFDTHAYPERDTHKEAHKALIAKVAEYQDRFRKDPMLLSVDVLTFLKGWLIDHIQGTDKKYGPFLKSKGVS